MAERPTGQYVADGSVDRLEEPERRHSPRRRALTGGVVAALVGGAVLTVVLHDRGGDAA